ncbi:hypothetical protein Nepgr_032788 [Nepenthes gracilis]|uniref:Uncharacterized protein n=1 Tax=Nepenthes gracilis TaxID=150966 RepID=A0AAD3Y7Y1_NEPGR|nr:hypothetical protein Nepgr_032788 [Nepenthes gracilis]
MPPCNSVCFAKPRPSGKAACNSVSAIFISDSMSTRVSREAPKAAPRNTQRRKMVLNVDLNVPVVENFGEEGTSSHPPTFQEAEVCQQVTLDVDSIDDDVLFTSPMAFAEAKHNSRRSRGRTIVDIDLEESTKRAGNNRNKRQRVPSNQAIINCESYVNLELSASNMRNGMRAMSPLSPPPKEPTFNCPVCMGPLVEEMSTNLRYPGSRGHKAAFEYSKPSMEVVYFVKRQIMMSLGQILCCHWSLQASITHFCPFI